MNKFGMVLGVAAVATLAGCKDPDYKHGNAPAVQNEVKDVETVEVETAAPKCQCPPGTKHASPCKCGAPDCTCIVETKPVIVADVSKPAVASAAPVAVAAPVANYTIYVVQNGDYLAKISKKFNVTIASIKRLNPSIKKDVIWVGQKLKLPGKIDVGVQAEPVKAVAKPAKTVKKSFVPYAGATKEYVVKNGDTLGSIAYGNGINIRQLKDLNGLTKDSLKVGQKLKVPAEKVVQAPAKAAKPVAAAKPVVAEKKSVTPVAEAKKPVAAVAPAPAVAAPAPAVAASAPAAEKPATVAEVEAPVASAPAAEQNAAVAPAPEKVDAPETSTYVVQEGDDMTGVAIRWGISAAAIRELNNLGENDQLVPGQVIKLPAEAQQ